MNIFVKAMSFALGPIIDAAAAALLVLAGLIFSVEHEGNGEKKAEIVTALFMEGVNDLPIPERYKKLLTGKILQLWIKAVVWNANQSGVFAKNGVIETVEEIVKDEAKELIEKGVDKVLGQKAGDVISSVTSPLIDKAVDKASDVIADKLK